jgi:hypothetical protein
MKFLINIQYLVVLWLMEFAQVPQTLVDVLRVSSKPGWGYVLETCPRTCSVQSIFHTVYIWVKSLRSVALETKSKPSPWHNFWGYSPHMECEPSRMMTFCTLSIAALKPAPATYFLLPGKEWNYIIFSHNGQHLHVNPQWAPSLCSRKTHQSSIVSSPTVAFLLYTEQ